MSKTEDKSPVREAELQAIIQSQQEKISHLQQQMDRMTELLLIAQRARFGHSSEKAIYVSPEQITYFDEAENAQDIKAPEPTEDTITVGEHQRKTKRTIEELTANLPVKEVVLELAEKDMICVDCGDTLQFIEKNSSVSS